MATIKKFEDIEIWQLARKLNKDAYPFLVYLTEQRNFELNRQLEKSLGSIMDNVAEGFERNGNKEFVQFLSISKASAGEARSQFYRALDRELLSREEFDKFNSNCLTISDKIGKFMNYLRESGIKGNKYRRKGNEPETPNNK